MPEPVEFQYSRLMRDYLKLQVENAKLQKELLEWRQLGFKVAKP